MPLNLWEKLLYKDTKLYLKRNTLENNSGDKESIYSIEKEPSQNYKIYSQFLVSDKDFKTEQDFKKIFSEEESTRTSVNRIGQSEEEEGGGNLFQFSTVRYHANKAGLYFLAQFSSVKSQMEFESLLSLLGDTGIGADKSSGKGQFSFEKEDCPIKKSYSGAPSFSVNLSLFSPRIEEMKNKSWIEKSKYELIKRGGWIHNQSIRRKSCFMFKEGSRFTYSKENSLKGEMKNVTPSAKDKGLSLDHEVWRDGRAFLIHF